MHPRLPKPETERRGVVRLDDEVVRVPAVILAAVLAVDLEAVSRGCPSNEQRCDLIVRALIRIIARGVEHLRDVPLEQGLEQMCEVSRRDPRLGPWRVNETRDTGLEAV